MQPARNCTVGQTFKDAGAPGRSVPFDGLSQKRISHHKIVGSWAP